MDWLKDKKNQPIVALIAAVVIVAVVVIMYFTMFKPSDDSAAGMGADTSMPTDPNAGMDPSMMPTDPNAPADPAAPASAGAQVASTQPTEAWRHDPFLPIGYKPPVANKGPKPKPPIWDLPIPAPIFRGQYMFKPEDQEKKPKYEYPQPARRMAGLMLNGKVYAIIETNGKSEIVQPGDSLEDGLAVVEKIERDKVILKTTDDKPRFLVVSMAAGRRSDLNSATPGGSSSSGPSMPGPGMMPMGPGLPRPTGM